MKIKFFPTAIFLIAAVSYFSPLHAYAINNICNLEDNGYGFQSLLWDTKSGEAKAVYRDGTVFTGRYLFDRKANAGDGDELITQLYFDYRGAYVYDAAEYKITKYIDKNTWARIIGVNYFSKEGRNYIDSIEIETKANCLNL